MREKLNTQIQSDDTQTEKLNTKHKSGKLSNRGKQVIAMMVVVTMILVYIIYECYTVTKIEFQTITAVQSTVYQSINTTALTVRDEHIINTDSSGAVTVACQSDGEKVKKGGKVAMEFDSASQAQAYSTKQGLQQELDYYLDMSSQTAGSVTDIKKIDSTISDDVNSFIRSSYNGDMTDVTKTSSQLNSALTRRQLIIGQNIDFSTITGALTSQIGAIDDNCNPTGYVTTENSGIFSAAADGYESTFDYSDITDISKAELENDIKKVQEGKGGKKESDSLGKIITSYNWYFCAIVPTADLKEIDNGDVLEVAVTGSDKLLNCTVVKGGDSALEQDSTVLILECADMDSEITAYRLENIEIRYNKYEGIKVPADSVHIVDGSSGVYSLVSSQVKFRKAEVLYSQNDSVWLKYDPNSDGGIRLYDSIITKGKELYDGKVIT